MLIGYARVSTDDQKLDLQADALKRAGVDKVYSDKLGGAKDDRPGLAAMLAHARAGDVVTVWRLDRLGRSMRHLITVVEDLAARGVQFRSLTEGIDTTTPGGKLFFHMLAALAQFERDLIRERTNAGLAAARARGRVGGRPKAPPGRRRELAVALYKDPANSVADVCQAMNISKATLYRILAPTGPEPTT